MARDRYDDNYDDRDEDDGYREERRGTPPPNYLGFAIFVTLCCCLIGGIIAIINASQVSSKWAGGDSAGARASSDNAKLWCWLSFGIGLPLQAIIVIMQIMAEQKGGGDPFK